MITVQCDEGCTAWFLHVLIPTIYLSCFKYHGTKFAIIVPCSLFVMSPAKKFNVCDRFVRANFFSVYQSSQKLSTSVTGFVSHFFFNLQVRPNKINYCDGVFSAIFFIYKSGQKNSTIVTGFLSHFFCMYKSGQKNSTIATGFSKKR